MNNINLNLEKLCDLNFRVGRQMFCKKSYDYDLQKTKHICEHPEVCVNHILIANADSQDLYRFIEYTRRK